MKRGSYCVKSELKLRVTKVTKVTKVTRVTRVTKVTRRPGDQETKGCHYSRLID